MSCFQQVWDWLFQLWRFINQLPLCICCSSSRSRPLHQSQNAPDTISRLYGSQGYTQQSLRGGGGESEDIRFEEIPIDDTINEFNMRNAFQMSPPRGGTSSRNAQADETPLHPPIRLEVLPPEHGTFISRQSLTSRWPSISIETKSLKLRESLGRGHFGWILKGKLNSDADVIITQLKVEANQHETQEYLDEAKFWAEATWGKGPQTNVIRMLGVCLDAPPYMVIFDAGEAFTCDLKTFLINGRDDLKGNERLVIKFCSDVTNGLNYLHEMNCIPSDLSARCCQINASMTVKVGDFGLARSNYPDDYIEMEPKVHLPLRWMAPEFLALASTLSGGTQVDLFKALSKEANMWSLGITLWEVAAFGNTPFPGLYNSHFLSADSYELVGLLRNGPGPVELTNSFSQPLMPIINCCLAIDPKDRPSTLIARTHLEVMLNNSLPTQENII